jgi:hypothetical protein
MLIEWSHVRGYATFHLSSITVLLCTAAAACTTKYKIDLQKIFNMDKIRGLVMGRILD